MEIIMINKELQEYIIKNILDPKYTAAQNQAKNNQKPPQDNNNLMQHYIQQKVLVTDPKTGKQMYVMKNVIDPKYEKAILVLHMNTKFTIKIYEYEKENNYTRFNYPARRCRCADLPVLEPETGDGRDGRADGV